MTKILLQKSGKKIHLGGKESSGAKGIHLISICDARKEKAQKLEERLEEVRIKRTALYQASLGIEINILKAKMKGENWDFFQKQLLEIEEKMKDLWDEFQWYWKFLRNHFLLREFLIENITTTTGRTVSARRLSGNNTYTGNVTHTALGTDSTAPVVGNTQLGTETYRKAISSGTFASNIAYLETFYTASEVNGTFQEYGNFIDGSGTANSGQLFNRFTQAVTKSVTETLNVQSTVTFNDA